MRALARSGEELAAIGKLRAALATREDSRLRYLLGRLLLRVSKEVEGSGMIELAREQLGLGEGGGEDVLAELDDLLVAEEDEADPGHDP